MEAVMRPFSPDAPARTAQPSPNGGARVARPGSGKPIFSTSLAAVVIRLFSASIALRVRHAPRSHPLVGRARSSRREDLAIRGEVAHGLEAVEASNRAMARLVEARRKPLVLVRHGRPRAERGRESETSRWYRRRRRDNGSEQRFRPSLPIIRTLQLIEQLLQRELGSGYEPPLICSRSGNSDRRNYQHRHRGDRRRHPHYEQRCRGSCADKGRYRCLLRGTRAVRSKVRIELYCDRLSSTAMTVAETSNA